MNEEVRLSRLRVSRRRALAIGGTVGLSGVLAACATASTAPSVGEVTTPAVVTDPAALLDVANTCVLAEEQGQGPYWFDVDSIRSDIRDGRPGLTLSLAMRVHDLSSCKVGGPVRPVSNAVVEIWHCDAGGVYSGYATIANSRRGRPSATPSPAPVPASDVPGAPNMRGGEGPDDDPGWSGELSDGSYSSGDPEATPTDDGTYLRGAQATDADGIVRFTSIFPGWYVGRTTHVHCKVHIDRRTVLTTQLFVDDTITDEIYLTVPPYRDRPRRDTRNDTDTVYSDVGLMTVQRSADAVLAAINLGLNF
jgi:protocatechuate 3,4-dioxygenase beta subunit